MSEESIEQPEPDPREGEPIGVPEAESDANEVTEPTEPADPTEPTEPADPTEAAVPVEPAEPTWQRFDLRTDADAGIAAAQAAIAAGECIVLPTDTVYGIGANAFSASAVQGLLDAKRRGRDMPPPVLISEPAMLDALGADVESYAKRLADEFWPGALTLIVKMQPSLRVDLGETAGTIALRVPDHDATRELLRRTGPLAVSSANVSGQPASTSIDDAIEQLGNSVSVYLDAGPTPGEMPSTIVDFVSEMFGRIVRQGALSEERIRDIDPFVQVTEPGPSQPDAESGDPDPADADPDAEPAEARVSEAEAEDLEAAEARTSQAEAGEVEVRDEADPGGEAGPPAVRAADAPHGVPESTRPQTEPSNRPG